MGTERAAAKRRRCRCPPESLEAERSRREGSRPREERRETDGEPSGTTAEVGWVEGEERWPVERERDVRLKARS